MFIKIISLVEIYQFMFFSSEISKLSHNNGEIITIIVAQCAVAVLSYYEKA